MSEEKNPYLFKIKNKKIDDLQTENKKLKEENFKLNFSNNIFRKIEKHIDNVAMEQYKEIQALKAKLSKAEKELYSMTAKANCMAHYMGGKKSVENMILVPRELSEEDYQKLKNVLDTKYSLDVHDYYELFIKHFHPQSEDTP